MKMNKILIITTLFILGVAADHQVKSMPRKRSPVPGGGRPGKAGNPSPVNSSHDDTCVDDKSTAENCFDYFTLAVFWGPAYAYKQSAILNHEIRPSIKAKWSIHGLWPSMNSKSSPPGRCTRQDVIFTYFRFKNEKNLIGKINNNWYTILAKEFSNTEKFLEHEFKKHGSCASRSSGIKTQAPKTWNDVGYFVKTLNMFENLQNILLFHRINTAIDGATSLKRILEVIKDTVRVDVNVDTVSRLNKAKKPPVREHYLTEIYICYDVTLARKINCPNIHRPKDMDKMMLTLIDSVPKS